jgi:hypothetical protein
MPRTLSVRRYAARLWQILMWCGLLCLPDITLAGSVEEVVVRTAADGYEITVTFFTPMRYISLTPRGAGTAFQIQLKPESLDSDGSEDELDEHSELGWNKDVASPLTDIIFEGTGDEYPQLVVRFNEAVTARVRNGADLRSLVISVKSRADRAGREAPIKASPQDMFAAMAAAEPQLAALIDQARSALLDKDYTRAVNILTKIHDSAAGAARQGSLELRGLAREYNGQLAQAKRDYETYLKEYPEDDGTRRVRQRLAALLTQAAPGRATQQGRGQGRWLGHPILWRFRPALLSR